MVKKWLRSVSFVSGHDSLCESQANPEEPLLITSSHDALTARPTQSSHPSTRLMLAQGMPLTFTPKPVAGDRREKPERR
jgi:hypothetical protein